MLSSWWKKLRSRLTRKPRAYLVNDKYRVVPAFRLGGKDYYMFDNQMHAPTGRMLTALGLYEELQMRVDAEFLQKHTAAIEKVLSDARGINISVLAQLNNNLKERLQLLPLQDQVLKYASVVFFTKDEPIFEYDYTLNRRKIEEWKRIIGRRADVGAFFLKTPLADLIPSLKFQHVDSEVFLEMRQKVDEIHRELISATLSANQ